MMFRMVLLLIALAAGSGVGKPTPGLAVKVNDVGIQNLNELISPIIMSRYTETDHDNLNIQVSGPNYSLVLQSLKRFIFDPLSLVMEGNIVQKPVTGFNMRLSKLAGYATFTSSLTIKGKVYNGMGQLILDQTTLSFLASFTEQGPNQQVELKVANVAVNKDHIAVIYKDSSLNSTLNEYKDVLREAYAQAMGAFVYRLVGQINDRYIRNLVLGYTGRCGFNVTIVQAPYFDASNNEVVFFFDGSIVDLQTMRALTTVYPTKFPLDSLKNVHKSRFVFSDTTLAGMLVACPDHVVSYAGRRDSIQKTTEQVPEIFTKYLHTDEFYLDVTLTRPFNLLIREKDILLSALAFISRLLLNRSDD